MRLHIQHATRYTFDQPVAYGLQQLRKTPKSTYNQTVSEWQTRIEGGKKELAFEDHHRNTVELISFARDTTFLSVFSEGMVDIVDNHGILGAHEGVAPLWLYRMSTPQTETGSGIRQLLKGVSAETDIDKLHEVSEIIHDTVPYTIGASEPDWTAEKALEVGKGVCQDHTHIFLAAARALGFPARYVSGYLMLNDTITQEAMHAWAEAYVDGLGWVGFDVSNKISPDTRYVRVATGLDYADAAPVSGTRFGAASEALHVEINVAQQ